MNIDLVLFLRLSINIQKRTRTISSHLDLTFDKWPIYFNSFIIFKQIWRHSLLRVHLRGFSKSNVYSNIRDNLPDVQNNWAPFQFRNDLRLWYAWRIVIHLNLKKLDKSNKTLLELRARSVNERNKVTEPQTVKGLVSWNSNTVEPPVATKLIAKCKLLYMAQNTIKKLLRISLIWLYCLTKHLKIMKVY